MQADVQELKTAFFLAEAPREVPLSLRCRLMLGGLAQFGWVFFGIGMIFVWIFVPAADLSFFTVRGPLTTAEGVVTRVERTMMNEGGGEHNSGTPVYAYHFTYTLPQGSEYEGISYATGRRHSSGAQVKVEYAPGAPDSARIKGMRRNLMPPLILFVLLFPLVGLGFVVFRLWKGVRQTRLLRHGSLALGQLVNKQATQTRINDQTVYKLTFEFADLSGTTQKMTVRSHMPETLEDDDRERLLYDPTRPQDAVLWDNVPGSPEVDERGQLKPTAGSALVVMIIPALSIIGHTVWGLFTLGVL